jgi:phosphoribosylamine--glycine ligase
VVVVLASGGYPGHYDVGKPIQGLDKDTGADLGEGLHVFQAGTKVVEDALVTAGGRVVAVTGLGQNLKLAIERAYKAVEAIRFDGMHFRKDIGQKALARLSGGEPS